ncbi:MAG: hypothetical protein KA354_08685 [Phycisphaerae bacterium]|nr:hypothetical protein [Phycisphaerae bacterium]
MAPGPRCAAMGFCLTTTVLIAVGWTTPALQGESPSVVVRAAPRLTLPGIVVAKDADPKSDGDVDCNSPAHWDGDTLFMFYSVGHPYRSNGPNMAGLSRPSVRTAYDNERAWREVKRQGERWIEATWKAPDGRLYMWYHNEPHPICGSATLTAPRIGTMVSTDNGLNWKDLGLILEAPADSLNCDTVNTYFAGGNGDFSVIPGAGDEYLYFFISTYNKDVAEQGVAVARMKASDRDDPRGKVFKWHHGQWSEPGLGGHVSPIYRVTADWHKSAVDAFWGPSIHWNTHLDQWVILLNRAVNKDWGQEGIYVSLNPDLAKPGDWSKPLKILDAKELEKSKWYPQVVGIDASRKETDKLAGRVARLFVAGQSKWEIVFLKPGER